MRKQRRRQFKGNGLLRDAILGELSISTESEFESNLEDCAEFTVVGLRYLRSTRIEALVRVLKAIISPVWAPRPVTALITT